MCIVSQLFIDRLSGTNFGTVSLSAAQNKYLITTTLYPRFHCNEKLLEFGLCVGSGPQREEFLLVIPTCWYLKSLVDPTQRPPDPTRAPTRPPTRANGIKFELGTRGLDLRWPCTFQVILYQFNSRWLPNTLLILVEYGLKCVQSYCQCTRTHIHRDHESTSTKASVQSPDLCQSHRPRQPDTLIH